MVAVNLTSRKKTASWNFVKQHRILDKINARMYIVVLLRRPYTSALRIFLLGRRYGHPSNPVDHQFLPVFINPHFYLEQVV